MAKLIELKLKHGLVLIQMFPEKAPKHCQIIEGLVNGGFYNGLKWHRVIDGFMAQTGCPFGSGIGGINFKIPAEFNNLKHIRGTVSMARSQDPNSASSQFFICFNPQISLDGQYTVWGQVIEGMEFVDKIKRGDPVNNGVVDNPDLIYYMRIIEEE
jgi:peptidylprolyl isomerase